MRKFARVEDIPVGFWRWRFFSPHEMKCKGTGSLLVVEAFMDRLTALRVDFAQPMVISSGYRSPEHNVRVSSTGPKGPHTTGRAVDVRLYGAAADRLLKLSYKHGFTGHGVAQKGAHGSRFVHLDDLMPPQHPRPMLWSY